MGLDTSEVSCGDDSVFSGGVTVSQEEEEEEQEDVGDDILDVDNDQLFDDSLFIEDDKTRRLSTISDKISKKWRKREKKRSEKILRRENGGERMEQEEKMRGEKEG